MRAWLGLVGVAVSVVSFGSPALATAQQTARGLYGVAIPTAAGVSEEQAVRDVLAREGGALGLDPQDPLRVVRTQRAHDYVIVELARVVHDLPVVGAPIVVRMRPDRTVDLVTVAPMPAAIGTWPAAAPLQAAADVARATAPFPAAEAFDSAPVPLVHDDALVPAVRVELRGAARGHRARAYVDARTLTLLYVEELTLDALGRVFPQNPTNDAGVTMDLPLEALTSATNLDGTYLDVQSCDQVTASCGATLQRAVADASGDFLFDPMATAFDDAFSEVSAYYHGTLVVDYFRTAHAFTWSCAGNPRMDVVVNYSEAPHVGYDNAMFVPGSRSSCGTLIFGQGYMHDYAYDGDVVYHEYGHAVTDQISSLGFFANGPSDNYQPLAINEGTSDYWAAAVQGDPNIGESIGSIEGFMGSLRGLDNTLACPADLVGEGHFDGRIWSAFGWALRGVVGQTRADALWFTTMASLSGGVTLAQATSILLATVTSEVSMGHITADEQTQILAAATARGLPDCTMFVPLDGLLRLEGYSGNQFVTAGLSHGLAPLEYTIQVPPDVVDVQINIDHATINGLVNVHFNTDSPVRATSTRITSQLSVPVGRGGLASFALAQGLVPCSTLYVGVETTDIRTSGESLFGIRAIVNTTHMTRACPPPRTDAGPVMRDAGHDAGDVADGGADGGAMPATSGGCGCRSTGAGGGRWTLVLLGLAFVIARRRRA